VQYVSAAAGDAHTVLLRNDGQALAFGQDDWGVCAVPPLPAGLRYMMAAAGANHTVLLRSDGEAVAFGSNGDGRCDIPARPQGVRYVSVAAGGYHTLLVRSDGQAVACGRNDHQQCEVPELPEGVTYVSTVIDENVGSTALPTALTDATEVPAATEVSEAAQAQPPAQSPKRRSGGYDASSWQEFSITLKKTAGGKIGLKVDQPEGLALEITRIKEGLVQEWNASNPELQVIKGDRIVEVNGMRNNSVRMLDVLGTEEFLDLAIARRI
jgi:hypothetical protein